MKITFENIANALRQYGCKESDDASAIYFPNTTNEQIYPFFGLLSPGFYFGPITSNNPNLSLETLLQLKTFEIKDDAIIFGNRLAIRLK